MPSTQPANTASKARFLALLILFVIAAGLISNCSSKDRNQNSRENAVQQPSPSPSPIATPAISPQEGDTIIVIKGGSVDLEFNETIYKSNGASNPTYICDTCAYKKLEVGPVGGPFTPCTIVNQNSAIVIHAGGGRKNIKIKRNSAAKIQVEFNAKEYGPDSTGLKKHYNPNNNINKVKVTPSLSCQCPTGKLCEIHVITSY
jgi:hypothetical protein